EELVHHPALVREFASETPRRLLVRGGLFQPSVYYPPISDVVVGRDGSTWLRWPDDGRGRVRWDVLDAAGRPVRTLELDRRLRILDAAADGIWAVTPEQPDVVTWYALEPPQ